jgi:hypothetical protein
LGAQKRGKFMNMAKHSLRSKSDLNQLPDGTFIAHNAIMVYTGKNFEYRRQYKDNTLSPETYTIPFELSTNEELWEELD